MNKEGDEENILEKKQTTRLSCLFFCGYCEKALSGIRRTPRTKAIQRGKNARANSRGLISVPTYRDESRVCADGGS